MGWLKKFVKWSQKTFLIKYIIAGVFLIIGVAGLILPILQGLPLIIIAGLIVVPNKKLHKKIFKYEKIISWSIIIGVLILLIVPAVLYYYGVFDTGFAATYGRFALQTLQIGQEPIRTGIKAIVGG